MATYIPTARVETVPNSFNGNSTLGNTFTKGLPQTIYFDNYVQNYQSNPAANQPSAVYAPQYQSIGFNNTVGGILNNPVPQVTASTVSTVPMPTVNVAMNNPMASMRNGFNTALNNTAKKIGEIAGTTKANWNAQSFGEKFNTIGSTIGSIMNVINARKQLKLTRQALGHQMAMDNKNYDMARKQWNHVLEDKARYREAMAKDQGRSYETVGEMMAKYGA